MKVQTRRYLHCLGIVLKKYSGRSILFVLLLFFGFSSRAQTVFSGRVVDAMTGDPIPFASVSIVHENQGTLTDTNGFFRLTTNISKGSLRFAAASYDPRIIRFTGSRHLNIGLKQNKSVLADVHITDKRRPYHNKNNPAVALIRQVIKHKKENELKDYAHVQYTQYQRIVMSYENPGKLIERGVPKKFRFIFNDMDTTSFVGKKLLPLFIEEQVYKDYYQKSPLKKRSILLANKRVNFNPKYVNNQSLGKVLRYIYPDIDIYKDNLFILTNNFLSPIANLSPQFYRFYITDTLTDSSGLKIVKLAFEPRNSHDILLYGSLYVALNGHYSVTKATLALPKLSNINWVRSMTIALDYAPNKSGKYYLKRSQTGIEVGLQFFKDAVFTQRTNVITHFDTHTPIPDSVFVAPKQEKVLTPPNTKKPKSYWLSHRPEPLTPAEKQTYSKMDSLNSMKAFNRLVSWISFISGKYKNVGPVEIGPYPSFYSFNPVEGTKLKIGGRTTDEFSKTIYLKGLVGYGFGDHRVKYFASAAYSFNKQNIFYGYPAHYFQVTDFKASRIPGNDFQFRSEGSFLFSFQHGENNRFIYNHVFQLDYVNELIHNFRIDLSYRHWQQQAAGILYFIGHQHGEQDTLNQIVTAGFGLQLRWTPHAKILLSRGGRTYLPTKYPMIKAQLHTSIKGLNGGQYTYHSFVLNVSKRFHLGQLGQADVSTEGGYLLGKVPYPLLFSPSTSQSFLIYKIDAFNLMNYMEFLSDHYVSLKIDYHMRGFILNKIPLIRWMRLREVAGFKMVYGALRSENMPNLADMPKDDKGRRITFPYNHGPYMEFNVGVENIFNMIRVDYVRRLNYLHHPGISKNGVRFSLHFTF